MKTRERMLLGALVALLGGAGCAHGAGQGARSQAQVGKSQAPGAESPVPAPVLLRPRMIRPTACRPHFPREMEGLCHKVTLTVKYIVTLKGRVEEPIFLVGGPEPFESAVLAALARCEFHPATQDGVPIPVYMTQPFTFTPCAPEGDGGEDGAVGKASRGEHGVDTPSGGGAAP